MRDTLIDGLDVLYHHAKFGNIVLQATAVGPVGAKIWCLYVCFYPRDVVIKSGTFYGNVAGWLDVTRR